MLYFSCEIPLRVAIKKNNTQQKYSFKKKRRYTSPSERYLQWEREVITYLRYHWVGRPAIARPVIMRATFELKNRRGVPDLSNAYQGLEDALEKAGVLQNDRLIVGHDGSRIKITGRDAITVELYAVEDD